MFPSAPMTCPGRASSSARAASSAANVRTLASSQSSPDNTSWISISGVPLESPSYTPGSISVRETSAIPVGLRSRVPAKITSSIRPPRKLRADCSPSTQEMASETFDFPQPFGPTIAAIPSPWNLSSVRSQNDLNPGIWSFFSLSTALSFGEERRNLNDGSAAQRSQEKQQFRDEPKVFTQVVPSADTAAKGSSVTRL